MEIWGGYDWLHGFAVRTTSSGNEDVSEKVKNAKAMPKGVTGVKKITTKVVVKRRIFFNPFRIKCLLAALFRNPHTQTL